MTYTIKELEAHSQFSMTYFELQARVAQMGEVNSAWASKTGKRGSWIVSDSGFQVLIRLRALEDEGSSVKAGLEKIAEELAETSEARRAEELLEKTSGSNNDLELELLRQKLGLQESIIEDLRTDKARQQDIIDRLTLALPAPKKTASAPGFFSQLLARVSAKTPKLVEGSDRKEDSETPTIDI